MQSVNYCARSLRALVLLSLSFFAVCSIVHAQVLTYQLQPGATITRSPLGGVIFPSEPLTGTFQWTFGGTGTSGEPIFDLVSLSFSSPSFSIQMDPAWTSRTFFDSPPSTLGSLGAYVIATGLSPSNLYFHTIGNYTGPSSAPTSFNFVDNHSLVFYTSIVSFDSSYSFVGPIADTSFVAVLVPEPSSLILFGLGTLSFLTFTKRLSRS